MNQQTHLPLMYFVRAVFILVCGWVGSFLFHGLNPFLESVYASAFVGATIGFVLVALEMAFTKRFVTVISTVMFGLVFGFIVSHFIISALLLIPAFSRMDTPEFLQVQFAITFVCAFVAVMVILQVKDDFKFVVPFVEFSRETMAGRPVLLDTSVIIDGRIQDILKVLHLDAVIIVPRFVLEELQTLADSRDSLKRKRGRRGLDIVGEMRKCTEFAVQIHDTQLPEIEGVDAKIVHLARLLGGRVFTNDFNLEKVARVQGLDILNLNAFANALKPIVLPGEKLTIKIHRPGEESGQGVGYLDDGTMVVVQGGNAHIGQTVTGIVVSVLQTHSGRMIFTRMDQPGKNKSRKPTLPK